MAVWSRLDGESDDYADDVVETGSHHIGGVQKRKAALKRAVSASAATKVAVFLVQVVPIVFACYATLIGCALVIGGTGGCIDGTDGGLSIVDCSSLNVPILRGNDAAARAAAAAFAIPPSHQPSARPTSAPSTPAPTTTPTPRPTSHPSPQPTSIPTQSPTNEIQYFIGVSNLNYSAFQPVIAQGPYLSPETKFDFARSYSRNGGLPIAWPDGWNHSTPLSLPVNICPFVSFGSGYLDFAGALIPAGLNVSKTAPDDITFLLHNGSSLTGTVQLRAYPDPRSFTPGDSNDLRLLDLRDVRYCHAMTPPTSVWYTIMTLTNSTQAPTTQRPTPTPTVSPTVYQPPTTPFFLGTTSRNNPGFRLATLAEVKGTAFSNYYYSPQLWPGTDRASCSRPGSCTGLGVTVGSGNTSTNWLRSQQCTVVVVAEGALKLNWSTSDDGQVETSLLVPCGPAADSTSVLSSPVTLGFAQSYCFTFQSFETLEEFAPYIFAEGSAVPPQCVTGSQSGTWAILTFVNVTRPPTPSPTTPEPTMSASPTIPPTSVTLAARAHLLATATGCGVNRFSCCGGVCKGLEFVYAADTSVVQSTCQSCSVPRTSSNSPNASTSCNYENQKKWSTVSSLALQVRGLMPAGPTSCGAGENGTTPGSCDPDAIQANTISQFVTFGDWTPSTTPTNDGFDDDTFVEKKLSKTCANGACGVFTCAQMSGGIMTEEINPAAIGFLSGIAVATIGLICVFFGMPTVRKSKQSLDCEIATCYGFGFLITIVILPIALCSRVSDMQVTVNGRVLRKPSTAREFFLIVAGAWSVYIALLIGLIVLFTGPWHCYEEQDGFCSNTYESFSYMVPHIRYIPVSPFAKLYAAATILFQLSTTAMTMVRLTAAAAPKLDRDNPKENQTDERNNGATMLIAYFTEITSTLLVYGMIAGIAVEMLAPTVGSHSALIVSRIFLVVAIAVGLVTTCHSVRRVLQSTIIGDEESSKVALPKGEYFFLNSTFQIRRLQSFREQCVRELSPTTSAIVSAVVAIPCVFATAAILFYDVVVLVLAAPAAGVAAVLTGPCLLQGLSKSPWGSCGDGRKKALIWSDTNIVFPAVLIGMSLWCGVFTLYVLIEFWRARAKEASFTEFATFTFHSATSSYGGDTGQSHGIAYLLCLLITVAVTIARPLLKLAQRAGFRLFFQLLTALLSVLHVMLLMVILSSVSDRDLEEMTADILQKRSKDEPTQLFRTGTPALEEPLLDRSAASAEELPGNEDNNVTTSQPGKQRQQPRDPHRYRFAKAFFPYCLYILSSKGQEDDPLLLDQMVECIRECETLRECVDSLTTFCTARKDSIMADFSEISDLMFRF